MALYKVLFADDTNLFMSHKNPDDMEETINRELRNVAIWFRCNKLSLNINKTNYIVFLSKQNQLVNKYVCLKINEQIIERVNTIKFLGVFIDECLQFKCHIDQLITKLSKYVGLFFKVRHFLPQSALVILYKTLFESHLNYCNVIWCNTFTCYLKKIQSLQKKIIRVMTWSEPNTPSRLLFHRLGLLRLTEYNSFLV